jgi:hypothetical protein
MEVGKTIIAVGKLSTIANNPVLTVLLKSRAINVPKLKPI